MNSPEGARAAHYVLVGQHRPRSTIMDADFAALSLAYLVFVCAGFVTDALRFRIATMAASGLFIVWGLIADNLGVVGWNIAFVALNTVQAIRIRRRDAVRLDPDDEAIRLRFFPDLRPRDFLTLWTAGSGEQLERGTTLCRQGDDQNDVLLLLAGDVAVTSSSGLDRTRSAPSFIGEMSYLTGGVASADVAAATPVTVHRWGRADLRRLSTLDPACALAWERALGRDVSDKLSTIDQVPARDARGRTHGQAELNRGRP